METINKMRGGMMFRSQERDSKPQIVTKTDTQEEDRDPNKIYGWDYSKSETSDESRAKMEAKARFDETVAAYNDEVRRGMRRMRETRGNTDDYCTVW
ncbi:hypothetical protein HZA38_00140 [Candidatus Peregrinibacteria bacterium]|nr:hypothetical protein [Candidatus Peregrinibacteria bacterium]